MVVCCQYERDAQRILRALEKRLAKYRLALNADKTRLVPFSSRAYQQQPQAMAFAFLGFIFYWGRSHKGAVIPKLKTEGKRLRAKLKRVGEWARRMRNQEKLLPLWKRFCAKLTGHIAYFGVSFNGRAVQRFLQAASVGYPVQATAPGHVWSWDFIMDRTTDGRPVKMLTMVDEYTRQCLIIHPARSITSDQVLDILEYLAKAWGAPAFIRSDNGSEFIAQIIQDWCHTAGVQTLYIEPKSPWQNGFIESFHSRFRDECLNQEIFFSIAETRVVVEDYRRLYNEERPHSSLGYKTPDEFARSLKDQPADTRRTSHLN